MNIILFIIWYVLGVISFIYWWTTEFDLCKKALGVGLFAGIIGPFAFILGWSIHGKTNKVLMKKR